MPAPPDLRALLDAVFRPDPSASPLALLRAAALAGSDAALRDLSGLGPARLRTLRGLAAPPVPQDLPVVTWP